MTDVQNQLGKKFVKSIVIDASAAKIWSALTQPDLMKEWMADTEIVIDTEWKTGGPIIIRGEEYWVPFENRGLVLEFRPERVLRYSHLSSLSCLPDRAENYTIQEFELKPAGDGIELTLTLAHFPTESIYRHMAFYWGVTLGLLKEYVEKLTSQGG